MIEGKEDRVVCTRRRGEWSREECRAAPNVGVGWALIKTGDANTEWRSRSTGGTVHGCYVKVATISRFI